MAKVGRPPKKGADKKVVLWRVSYDETLAQMLQIEWETFRQRSDVLALAINTLWETMCESGEIIGEDFQEYVSRVEGDRKDD